MCCQGDLHYTTFMHSMTLPLSVQSVAADDLQIFKKWEGYDGNRTHYLYVVRHFLDGPQILLKLGSDLIWNHA